MKTTPSTSGTSGLGDIIAGVIGLFAVIALLGTGVYGLSAAKRALTGTGFFGEGCFPAWNFQTGCYSADNSYLVDAFAQWMSECAPSNRSPCEAEARAHYGSTCEASSYSDDCDEILDRIVAAARDRLGE